MKKYICIIIVISLICFAQFYNQSCLSNIVLRLCKNCEIIEDNLGSQIVKIDGCEYEQIIDELNLEIYSEKYIEDRLIIEGYSNRISNYISNNNLKINVQIAVSDSCVIIGCPLIKNSF